MKETREGSPATSRPGLKRARSAENLYKEQAGGQRTGTTDDLLRFRETYDIPVQRASPDTVDADLQRPVKKRRMSDSELKGISKGPLEKRQLDVVLRSRQSSEERSAIEKDHLQRETELKSLLEKAKPGLFSEATTALGEVEQGLKENRDYTTALKTVLRELSPEIMDEFEKHGIKFVRSERAYRPSGRENKDGEWEVALPVKYDYPTKGMILRCFDEILRYEEEKYEKAAKQSPGSGMPDGAALTRRRAEVAAMVFQANMKLGKEHGWSVEGYEMAEKYHKNYEHGIREAFGKGLIGKETPEENLREIGNKHATEELMKTTNPPEGVPRVFFPLHPGSFFEEFNIKTRVKINKSEKTGKDGKIKADRSYRVEEPAEIGSPEFEAYAKKLSTMKKEQDKAFNVIITLDKKILALPGYFPDKFPEKVESQHSIVAKGNSCAWAGEIIAEGKKILKIKDQSGHFKTFDHNETIQREINEFVLQTFRDKGYEVPSEIELFRN